MMTLPYPRLRQPALLAAIAITSFISACSPFAHKGDSASHSPDPHTSKTPTPVEKAPLDEVVEVADVWAELPKGFGLPEVNESKISNHLRWYGNNQRYIDKISEQSRPFLYYVKSQLAANQMPLELALLPIVESAYDPLANSPSRAAGIWQFMPHTGRNFGLQQNQWYDGRRDLIASTDAAIRYLQYLHKMFDGDWLLAVAAYNAGEGTISRAIRKNQRAGHKADFWSLPLSQQTRSYVPQLLALSKVVANPAHYDLKFAPIPDQPYFVQVALTHPIDMAQAANHANIDAHQLRLLNAGHIKWLTLPPQDKTLLVPVDKAPALRLAIDQLPALGPIKTQANYTVKSGDTLGAIAQRFGTRVAAIQQLNRMKDSRLRVGQTLLIPDQTIVASAQGANVEQALAEKRQQQQPIQHYYRVKAGDSLWSIAKKHNVKLAQLLKWNNLNAKSTLKPGQRLIIAETKAFTRQDGKITYKIQPGDTLYTIASRFEVSHNDLLSWNQVKDASYIHPGQELTILK